MRGVFNRQDTYLGTYMYVGPGGGRRSRTPTKPHAIASTLCGSLEVSDGLAFLDTGGIDELKILDSGLCLAALAVSHPKS